MIRYEASTNISIAANTTEAIFTKTGFRAFFREFTFYVNGDDATGDIDSSLLRITLDGIVVFVDLFADISNYYIASASGDLLPGGMIFQPVVNTEAKLRGFRFTAINALCRYSLEIEIFNADVTNPLTVYSSIIYDDQLDESYYSKS